MFSDLEVSFQNNKMIEIHIELFKNSEDNKDQIKTIFSSYVLFD